MAEVLLLEHLQVRMGLNGSGKNSNIKRGGKCERESCAIGILSQRITEW